MEKLLHTHLNRKYGDDAPPNREQHSLGSETWAQSKAAGDDPCNASIQSSTRATR